MAQGLFPICGPDRTETIDNRILYATLSAGEFRIRLHDAALKPSFRKTFRTGRMHANPNCDPRSASKYAAIWRS